MRGFAVLWLAALVVLIAACSSDAPRQAPAPIQRLDHWTLELAGRPSRPIVLPTHLDDDLPDQVVVYHLRGSFVLDAALRRHELELVIPYLPSAVTVVVGGVQARVIGDAEMASSFGAGQPRRWMLPVSTTMGEGPLDLDLAVQHVWSMSSHLDVAPELVLGGTESPRAARNGLLNERGAWFGMVALSQVGMTFLAVYFWDRRRRAYLWFAIQALTASYYPAYVLGLPFMLLGWKAENIVLAQSLAVAPIISVYFTHEFFRLGRPHRAWLVLLGIALVSPLLVVARSSTFFEITYAARLVTLCVFAACAYQLATGVRLVRTHADRNVAVFFLLCWMALAGSCWVDLLAWAGGPDLLAGGRPACLGLGLFGIFQSMLLGRSHFSSLAESDRLNARLVEQVRDLRERQGQIETLNDELRRQIGRRSQDILAALTSSDALGAATLGAGDLVEGRYRILGPLGAGGMGTVYEVERLSDSKRLALKVTQEVRGIALARLAREAQIATQIHHPNVVAVVDADVAQAGYAFLVMELVAGKSLAQYEGEHRVDWCLAVMRQVLGGVRALHAEGIIHRDLKPSNVLVAENEGGAPLVKITDFGISRWVGDDPLDGPPSHTNARAEPATVKVGTSPRSEASTSPGAAGSSPRSTPQLTRTGNITGTPSYVAPELAGGTAFLSPAVDVFSFGVLAYGLLTGMAPFAEPPLLARIDGRAIPAPAPLRAVRPAVPELIGTGIDACLSVDPKDRPSVDELLSRLEKLQAA